MKGREVLLEEGISWGCGCKDKQELGQVKGWKRILERERNGPGAAQRERGVERAELMSDILS